MARLIFLSDRFAGRVHELTAEVTRVGRTAGHDLRIEDNSVSNNHGEILVYGTEVIVRDHGSTNGSFVDGARIAGQSPVRHGQVIGFGSVDARLELSAADEFDTEGASSQTAAYLQRNWLKEASQPEAPTPPPPPTRAEPMTSDDTVQMRHRPADDPAAPLLESSQRDEAPPVHRLTSRWVLVVILLALALGALVIFWPA